MSKTGLKKQKIGMVVSDKMDKTRVVRVDRLSRHPLYKKMVKSFQKFKVHDEKNQSKVGDKVKIIETRPLSKEKCWRLVEIVEAKKE